MVLVINVMVTARYDVHCIDGYGYCRQLRRPYRPLGNTRRFGCPRIVLVDTIRPADGKIIASVAIIMGDGRSRQQDRCRYLYMYAYNTSS